MEASSGNKQKPVPGNTPLLETLTRDPMVNYDQQSEPVSVSDKDVGAIGDQDQQTNPTIAAEAVPQGSAEVQGHTARLVSIKQLVTLYGLNLGTIYIFIKTDPTFPYKNIGLVKKYVIDVAKFEAWLDERTNREKYQALNIPTATDLLERFKK